MRVLRWSRADQLVLEGLLWAVPVVALLDVVLHLVRAVRGQAVESTGSVPEGIVPSAQVVSGPLSGTLVVDDPSAAQYAWDLLPALLLFAFVAGAAWLLLGVVRSLRLGDPFTAANARRLTALGVLVVVGGLLLPLVHGISHGAIVQPLTPDDEPSSWTLHLGLWPAAVGVLVGFVAEVFSRGVRLREDVEGLV